MNTSNQELVLSVSHCVAGEDLRVGEYIAVLSTMGEFLSHAWDRCDLPPDEVVRVRYVPSMAGIPLKVFGICLPFVYTRQSNGSVAIVDLRMTRVARLDKGCAKEFWKHSKTHPMNI